MENLRLLIQALEYIEDNLTQPIKTEAIADHLHCSKSTIEKLFKYINNISIRDYIIRRRMSKASRDIVHSPEKSLLDIGIEYGYGSNEAFTRAFYSVWQVSPSEFRKNPSLFELFPGYRIDRELMEEKTMADRKKIDISELYDCIKGRKGCFLILGDIKSLIPINEISHKAGDLAIITAMKRMEQAAGPDDVVFRIGGDEFVMLTNSSDENYAKKVCEEILNHNEECIVWEGKEIPMSMYVKAVRYEGGTALRYSEFFTMLQNELSDEYKKQYSG
ncbi:AraC family transcriptional regulator [Butyrivibrio fibrisolvens DSM 3071]|uniref:AraC family transcriptional regulator n=1 Tax=Butyrivibrio fibrisolvens DSM 3071 TaxID=1121131 RepID=A0A1M5ZSX1_BUTFI|nr:helix-turn-helix domain-containing protein [Butyrivibrio fibrisolvens]SHI27311.1 AraC family transcriptional regulator [Butyrivibrio fibrisolvens DSM 3071]